jgi:tetratricopeptide (TPR) repeat protein
MRGAQFQRILPLLPVLVFAQRSTPAASDPNQGWVEVRTPHFTVATNAGEKDGRRIASQFEQIRAMFQAAFNSQLRVDPAQPIIILAAKNEATMKLLVPEDWSVKGHVHHSGMYQEGEDKHYVIMRLDAEGNNPFHTLYHEYTHALLHLNFSDLPLWLDEGLAEFFGNSTLGTKESRTGTINEGHLYILNQNKLLPVETLLQVDHKSPYYNEANRASVFYAESWALVHYLMLDPDARQRQLLGKFLQAWNTSGNQIDAAREAFGDPKAFGQLLERYARQTSFQYGLVKAAQTSNDANYSVRAIPPAEALALRGDFFSHSNQLALAQPALEQALQLGPDSPVAHEALGYYQYRKQAFPEAAQQMQRSIELGSKSFIPFFYRGLLLVRAGEQRDDAIASLQKATQMNPQFAPGFEALAQVYAQSPTTQKEGIAPAIQAVKLDPYSRPYRVNLAYLLVNNDRDADARVIGEKLLKASRNAEESEMAQQLLNHVRDHQQWVAQRKAAVAGQAVPGSGSVTLSMAAPPSGAPAGPGIPLKTPASMAVDGPISAADCTHIPEVTFTLKLSHGPMTFHIADFTRITVSAPTERSLPKPGSCQAWTGRQVKVWFRPTQGQEYLGEVSTIYFLEPSTPEK